MIHPVLRRRDGLVVAGCLALLLLLARLIDPRQPPRFDAAVLDWLQQHLPAGLGPVLLQIYKLSGVQVTGVLVLASLVYLVLRRWWRDLRLLVMAAGGILLLVDMVLKPLFDRARPHDGLLELEGRSFPSGHAAGSVAFYGAMVMILASHHPQLRRPLTVVASLWIAVVWLSTLQARAHWPTDLLAGGAVGLAWLTLCLSLWRRPAAATSVAVEAQPGGEADGEG